MLHEILTSGIITSVSVTILGVTSILLVRRVRELELDTSELRRAVAQLLSHDTARLSAGLSAIAKELHSGRDSKETNN